MTMQASELATLVARYARRFHDVAGTGHHVASPLGAWLLLALCGPATTGATRPELEHVLGCDAEEAAAVAAGLLEAPHPAVGAAAAVWNRNGAADQRWLAGLPGSVERGPIPSWDEADAWAREHTFGLIERFPLTITPNVYLLLATALATKVSWDCPFEVRPAAALGEASPWAGRVERVLESPEHPGHSAFVAATAEVGDVGVHVGRAREGLVVVSVIAAPEVPARDVMAVGYELATGIALGLPLAKRSLFDLALGDGPLWSVREETSPKGAGEQCQAVLPVWEARSEHDLSDRRLGFAAAAAALGKGDLWRARQSAIARYTRVGFEAAAVTAMAIMLSMPSPGIRRTAELRFGHPFAVVAVAAEESASGRGREIVLADRWNGVPVFSAWVAEPADAGHGDPVGSA
jgi:hypothetical protein